MEEKISKVRFNIKDGEVEIQGTEEFVREFIDLHQFKDFIKSLVTKIER